MPLSVFPTKDPLHPKLKEGNIFFFYVLENTATKRFTSFVKMSQAVFTEKELKKADKQAKKLANSFKRIIDKNKD